MKRTGVLCIVGAVLAGGCGGKSGGPQLLNQDAANQLGAQHSNFDGKEPAINLQTRMAAGQLAESQNTPSRAVEQYKEALKIDPGFEPAMYRLAVVYTTMKAYPQAIAAWQAYEKQTNGAPNAWASLGFCQELAGRYDDAEASYQKGIAHSPKNVLCRTNYGLMLARHGRIDEATAQLSEVLAPAEVHYNLGVVYELRGMKAKAREEYELALKMDKELAEAQKRLAGLE